jgi:hypothetical protein
LFEVHEPRNLVFLRKALCQLQPMLADAADEVIGHTNVKRPSARSRLRQGFDGLAVLGPPKL